MRLLKLLLFATVAVVAVAAGIFVVAALALVGAAYLLVRWLRRRFGSQRNSRVRARRDVIEVTATEVPADPAERLR